MQKRYGGPQIVAKLRQADVLIGQGKTVPELCKELEISQQTYYRWRQKYGGMSPDMMKQHRALQKENARLRKVIADQALDVRKCPDSIEARVRIVRFCGGTRFQGRSCFHKIFQKANTSWPWLSWIQQAWCHRCDLRSRATLPEAGILSAS